jgi:hypothetical protein
MLVGSLVALYCVAACYAMKHGRAWFWDGAPPSNRLFDRL